MHTSSRPSTQAESSPKNNAGFTLSAIWTIRDIPRGVLGGNAKYVLNALVSFANATGHIEVDATRLSSAADMGKTTLMREIERLCLLGTVTIVRRGIGSASSVYRIEMDRLFEMKQSSSPPVRSQSPRGVSLQSVDNGVVSPGSEYEHGVSLPRVGNCESPGLNSGVPALGTFEEVEEREEDLLEDHASLPLATSQAPSTSRSPVVATASKARKRATRPKVEPLAYEALTAKEREVHDFIVGDALLVQICQSVPQLSRDLVGLATINGVVVVDVLLELRKSVQWNLDPNTRYPWSTAGGNRGLRSWIERASTRNPIAYSQTPSRPIPDLGNSYLNQDTPAPPKRELVDLGKNPELMGPKLYKAARFV